MLSTKDMLYKDLGRQRWGVDKDKHANNKHKKARWGTLKNKGY